VEWWIVALLLFGGLVSLIMTGMPIALAFILINLIGVAVYWGGVAGLGQFILSLFSSIGTFSLLPIVMFILMGEVMYVSGVGFKMIDVVDKWMGRLPGRLGLVAVASATIFGTLSGSSIATTAMLGATLTPEMEARGYKKPISIGAVMGSGGLAMLIPPSVDAVFVAAIAEISVGQLVIAGLIPGLVLGALYAGYIIIRCWLQPSIGPPHETYIPISLHEKTKLGLKYILPLGTVIFCVVGLILLGVATPTESAALGAAACFVLCACYRKMSWQVVKESVSGTLMITAMILLILCGAKAFSQILAFSGTTRNLIKLVLSLPLRPIGFVLALQGILLVLGCFVSTSAVYMMCIPLFMPIVLALGLNPVWFGMLIVLTGEMSHTTPPFGVLLFTMKGVAAEGTTMGDIIRSGLPFLACDAMLFALVVVFPPLALWLPSLIR